MEKQYGGFSLQWGVVCPEVVPVVWLRENEYGKIQWSAITGHTSDARAKAAFGWPLDKPSEPYGEWVDLASEPLREDVEACEAHMVRFQTRRDLWEYMMEVRDDTETRFVPGGLAIKTLTSASIAAVDLDPRAVPLAEAATSLLDAFQDKFNRERLRRLNELLRNTFE